MSHVDVDVPLQELANNHPSLTALNLSRKKIGKFPGLLEELSKSLVHNTNLTILDLSHNKIRDHGLKHIYYIVENNRGITSLDISFNLFSPCFVQKMTPIMKKNFTITNIHIEEYNTLTQSIKKFSCPRIAFVRRDIYSASEQNKKLRRAKNQESEKLSLSHRSFTTIPFLVYQTKWVTDLDLSHNSLQKIPPDLYKLSTLTRLNLSNNNIYIIESNGISNLQSLTNLVTIPLKTLTLHENLFLSTHTFPYYNLMSNHVKMQLTGRGNITIQENIPFTRIFFLGDTHSDVHKVVTALQEVQIQKEIYKDLSAKEKAVLGCTKYLEQAVTPDLWISDWFSIWETPNELLRTSSMETEDAGRVSPRQRHSAIRNLKRLSAHTPSFQQHSHSNPNSQYYHFSCWVLQEGSQRVQQLFVDGKNNCIPIVIIYKILPDSNEMLRNIVHLLYSNPAVNRDNAPPVFIVGTYSKAIDKMKNLVQSVQDKLEILFPHLNMYFKSVSASTRANIKSLSKIITEKIGSSVSSPFMFLDNSCDNEWIKWNEKTVMKLVCALRCKYEKIQTVFNKEDQLRMSILSWDEFVKIISAYNINEEMWEQTLTFLRYLGVLHHFRDFTLPESSNHHPLYNFIFLDSVILPRAYRMLCKRFKSFKQTFGETQFSVISREHIFKIWDNFPSKELISALLSALHLAGQVFLLFDHLYMIPFMLDSGNNTPHQNPPFSFPLCCTGRLFFYQRMSDYSYCVLAQKLYEFTVTTSLPDYTLQLYNITANCIEIRAIRSLNKEISDIELGFCRIRYNYSKNCVELYVWEKNSENRAIFLLLLEEMKQILSKDPGYVVGDPIYVSCVCCACATSENPSWFPLHELRELAGKGTNFVYCRGVAIRVDQIAPDLSLSNLQHLIVEYDRIHIIQKVGEGGFSSVYYGTFDGEPVAVKEIDKNQSLADSFPEFRKEVLLMAGLQHPNTAGLIALCIQPLCFLTDFCPFGDLTGYLESRRERKLPLPLDYIIDLLLDIAKGMNFLHSSVPPILHRDLKSPNILLCKISPDEVEQEESFPVPSFVSKEHLKSTVTARVADFGLSLRTRSPLTGRVVANPIWLAPEVISQQPYSSESDVYAFGIIAFEVISLEFPFNEFQYEFMHKLEQMIVEGKRPTIPAATPPSLRELIVQCWDPLKEKRPSFGLIVKNLQNMKKKMDDSSISITISDIKEPSKSLAFSRDNN